MERWTMQELKETDDITFAICILNERRRTLTPYSPLGMKLAEAAHTLHAIKTETEAYLARVSAAGKFNEVQEGLEDATDLSGCDEETKAQILANAERLEKMQCEPCQPTQPECGECEFAGGEDDAE